MSATRKIVAPDGTTGRTARSTRYVVARVAPERPAVPEVGLAHRPRKAIVLSGTSNYETLRRNLRKAPGDAFAFDLVSGEVVDTTKALAPSAPVAPRPGPKCPYCEKSGPYAEGPPSAHIRACRPLGRI